MEGKVELSTDFISDLPTSILHHILSYLSFKDSIRTSVLSKQGNSIRKSFPILQFRPPINHWMSLPRFNERIRDYLHFVDRSMKYFVQNKLSIEKMDLRVTVVDKSSVPLLNTWLPLALHKGVSDLCFHFVDENFFYPLPETTFMVNPSRLCGSYGFFLLKRLELSSVCLTEKVIQDIIRNCLNLTDLHLLSFYGLKTLNISKLNKLASLTISKPATLHVIFVDAPSLQRFSLRYQDESIPCEIDLTSCCNLREFDVWFSTITDAQFNMNVSRFPLLEVLKIVSCSTLRAIRISLQRLKVLILKLVSVEAIEIYAPVLSLFVWLSPGSPLPELVLTHSIPGSMDLAHLVSTEFDHVGSFWFLKIREYLTVPFNNITFSLHNYDHMINISFDLEELREFVIPPPVEIGCLMLTDFRLSSGWEALLDGLLWSCHPKEICTTFTPTTSDEDNCIKTLCRMLNKSECRLCSSLSHCKCWRRRFKAATIKGTNDIVFDELNVKSVTRDFFSKLKCQDPSEFPYAHLIPITCRVTVTFDWKN